MLRLIRELPLRLLVASIVVIAVLGACSQKTQEPFRDAPQGENRNSEPADIIEMPDGFSNLATKCDHGNRIYVAFKGDQNRAAVAVVPGGCS